jgi:anti-sigma regulatory factor (Ser/Thr protein kinase)
MTLDIFSLESPKSISRQLLDCHSSIDLAAIDLPSYEPGPEFRRHIITPRQRKIAWIKEAMTPITNVLAEYKYPPNLQTGIYEAVLNAYQHGNRRDPNKIITLADNIDEHIAQIAVIDQGGVLDSAMASYILLHRVHDTPIPDFYTFSGKKRNPENNGTGTRFMHIYFDRVEYFKSLDGGLLVRLQYLPSTTGQA